jgi:hypothetical protein
MVMKVDHWHEAYMKRQRRSAKCHCCKRRFKAASRGRFPYFCSQTCRQRAYEVRRAGGGSAIAALRRDIDTIRVQEVIRKEIRNLMPDIVLDIMLKAA